VGRKRERARYDARYAKATFRKDRRLPIQLSSKDLEAIQKRALEAGLPVDHLSAGWMFWFPRKKFVGSYFCLSAASRW
jgi:hypothetical protein